MIYTELEKLRTDILREDMRAGDMADALLELIRELIGAIEHELSSIDIKNFSEAGIGDIKTIIRKEIEEYEASENP